MEALIEAENAYEERCELFVTAYEYERRLRRELRATVKIRKKLESGVVDCLNKLLKYKKWRDKKERIGGENEYKIL